MRRLIVLLLIFSLVPVQAVLAAGAIQAMDEARARYSAGDKTGALDQLRNATMAIWNEAPLSARNVTFVTGPPEGFGMYQPALKNVFDTLEPVHLYLEPVGATVVNQGGLYKMGLAAGFEVKDNTGRVLGGQKNIQDMQTATRSFSSEVMMTLTFNFKGLPAGKYTLVVNLRDTQSGKKASFEKAFAVR